MGDMTDEMVERAAIRLCALDLGNEGFWKTIDEEDRNTYRDEARDVLTAALAVQPGSGWRPIAEAKWDGPAVDLWGRRTHSEAPRRFADCRYRLEYMNNGDQGWYDAEGKRVVLPTHFITIPEPPAEGK